MATKLPRPFGYAVATTIRTDPDGSVSVRYHATDVCVLNADGSLTLGSGRWRTRTTARRINQCFDFFNVKARLYQHRHEWFVDHGGQRLPFVDGMRLGQHTVRHNPPSVPFVDVQHEHQAERPSVTLSRMVRVF